MRDTTLADVASDLVAVGLHEGESLPEPLSGARGAADARPERGKLALLHPEGIERALVAGLGARDEMDGERARVAGAAVAKEARRIGARSLAWSVPEATDQGAIAAGLVVGTILAGYRFDRFRAAEEGEDTAAIESLTLLGPPALEAEARVAQVGAEAQNRARELQDLPANVATPGLSGGAGACDRRRS